MKSLKIRRILLFVFLIMFSLCVVPIRTAESAYMDVLDIGVLTKISSNQLISDIDIISPILPDAVLPSKNSNGQDQVFVILADINGNFDIPPVEFYCNGQYIDISENIIFPEITLYNSRRGLAFAIPIKGLVLESGKNYEFRVQLLQFSFSCLDIDENVLEGLIQTILLAENILNTSSSFLYDESLIYALTQACIDGRLLVKNFVPESSYVISVLEAEQNIKALTEQLENSKKYECVPLANNLILGIALKNPSGVLTRDYSYLPGGTYDIYLITSMSIENQQNLEFISLNKKNVEKENLSQSIDIQFDKAYCEYDRRLQHDLWYTPIRANLLPGNTYVLSVTSGLTAKTGETGIIISDGANDYALMRTSIASNAQETTDEIISKHEDTVLLDAYFRTLANTKYFDDAYKRLLALPPYIQEKLSLLIDLCEQLSVLYGQYRLAELLDQLDLDLLCQQIFAALVVYEDYDVAQFYLHEYDDSPNVPPKKEAASPNPFVGDESNVVLHVIVLLLSIALILISIFKIVSFILDNRPIKPIK